MMQRFVYALVISAFVVSCKSPMKKQEEAAPTPGAGTETSQDASISNKDIKFDARGSDSGEINGLKTVHFDYDDAKITGEAKETLDGNAKWIKENKGTNVQIEGHCDDRGSVEYNLSLGERRAKSIKSYLVKVGVDSNRLSVISYGKEKPIVAGESDEARAKNRRGNFVPMPK